VVAFGFGFSFIFVGFGCCFGSSASLRVLEVAVTSLPLFVDVGMLELVVLSLFRTGIVRDAVLKGD
jgi:hypothetical protein